MDNANALRGKAKSLMEMASLNANPESAARMRSVAERYLTEAAVLSGEAPNGVTNTCAETSTKAVTANGLRDRADYVMRVAAENPEPQWQKVKALAELYRREADALEPLPKKPRSAAKAGDREIGLVQTQAGAPGSRRSFLKGKGVGGRQLRSRTILRL